MAVQDEGAGYYCVNVQFHYENSIRAGSTDLNPAPSINSKVFEFEGRMTTVMMPVKERERGRGRQPGLNRNVLDGLYLSSCEQSL